MIVIITTFDIFIDIKRVISYKKELPRTYVQFIQFIVYTFTM